MNHAAGVLAFAPSGKALLARRCGADNPALWAYPGGGIEAGESAEDAARREFKEETGFELEGPLVAWTQRVDGETDFTTFLGKVPEEFTPRFNGEHDAHVWSLPAEALGALPLHPGAKVALARFGWDELEVAKAIRDGELTSPQRFANMLLVALRITGTGASYRQNHDEYVWRDPSIYLNEGFLERCAGLAVILEHPAGGEPMDSQEFHDRIIGNVFVPYLKGDEVWAVAKIYDAAMIEALGREPLSTSPCVVFKPSEIGAKIPVDGGRHILIEGTPWLLDHVCITALGVWDKGGAPSGVANSVSNTLQEQAPMAEEKTETKSDAGMSASKQGETLDKMLAHMDAFTKRLDAFMDSFKRKSRKDEDEEEEEEEEEESKPKKAAADKKRKDSARGDGEEQEGGESSKKALEEERGENKLKAADKQRKDSARGDDDDDDDKKSRKDAARKDDDDEDKKARKDASRKDDDDDDRKDRARKDDDDDRKDSARGDSRSDSVADLRRQLAELTSRMPVELKDEDRKQYIAAQQQCETVAQAFGDSAGAPRWLNGETLTDYRRRLLTKYKPHSAKWKDADLSALTGAVLDNIEQQVYADAVAAARNPANVEEGMLREVHETDRTGRQITRFIGDIDAFLQPFKQPSRFVTGWNNKGGQH